ncbi:MAG TPA: hypothetical protein VFS55_11590 [Dokdonella sp.]|nr:hypothetical protein [Dokdonella sp.]
MTALRRSDLRQAAEAAERRCRHDRDALGRALGRLRARMQRHAPAWLLGGGLACGAIAARLPLVAVLGAGRFLVDTASLVRRLPIGALARAPSSKDAA